MLDFLALSYPALYNFLGHIESIAGAMEGDVATLPAVAKDESLTSSHSAGSSIVKAEGSNPAWLSLELEKQSVSQDNTFFTWLQFNIC